MAPKIPMGCDATTKFYYEFQAGSNFSRAKSAAGTRQSPHPFLRTPSLKRTTRLSLATARGARARFRRAVSTGSTRTVPSEGMG
jgi:hypothetical protein